MVKHPNHQGKHYITCAKALQHFLMNGSQLRKTLMEWLHFSRELGVLVNEFAVYALMSREKKLIGGALFLVEFLKVQLNLKV